MIGTRQDEDVERAIGSAFLSLLRGVQAEGRVLEDAGAIAAMLAREGARLLPDAQCLVAGLRAGRDPVLQAIGVNGGWLETHRGDQWPLEGTVAALCLDTSQPLEITWADGETGEREPLNGGPMGTVRMVPLRATASVGAPLGIFGIYRPTALALTPAERILVDSFAALVGVALEHAVSRDRSRETEKRLRLGVDLSLDLGAADRAEQLARLVRRAVEVTRSARGSVGRIDGENLIVEEVYDRDGRVSSAGVTTRLDSQPVLRRALTTRRPVRAGRFVDSEIAPEIREVVLAAEHTLTLPLVFAGEVIAILVLQRRHPEPFDDADIDTAQMIGSVAGLALRNARLYASLEAAYEDSATFVSMVIHEMRSPLTVVSGYLEMMLSGMFGEVPETWTVPLNTVIDKSSELQGLVEDLLLSARLDSARQESVAERQTASDVVSAAVERSAEHARAAGGRVVLAPSVEGVEVMADRALLDRILDNLIKNALTHSGKPQSVVLTVQSDDDQVRFVVHDEGCGIAPEYHARVFERFYRVPVDGGPPGTGLGLFIGRQLARRLGGELTLTDSAPDGGSSFVIGLPKAPPAAEGEAERE